MSIGSAVVPAKAGTRRGGLLGPRFRGGGGTVDIVLAEIGPDHFRVAAHLGGGTVGDLAAVIEHDHVIGDPHHDIHIVLDEQYPDLLFVSHAEQKIVELGRLAGIEAGGDRKSTRLNSSHVEISYAVFCLKKKKKK